MTTILLLIALHRGEPKYLISTYDTLSECRTELALAVAELNDAKAIKLVRAECIQVGQPV